MTTQERKAKYMAEFNAAEQHIKNLNDELQKAVLYREQVRGKYLAMDDIEKDEQTQAVNSEEITQEE